MSASDSYTKSKDDWIVVGGCVVLTIQLLRCSIDIVKVASKPALKKDTKAPPPPSFHHYGSMSTPHGSTVSSNNNENDEEQQPLILSASSAAAAGSTRHFRAHVFAIIWILMALCYLAAAILHVSSLYSTTLLVFAAASVGLEVVLLYRDVAKVRYGGDQRFLHLTASLSLWIIFAVLALQGSSKTTKYDAALLLVSTLVVLMAVLDGWLSTRAAPAQEESQKSDRKKRLDGKAFSIMLRPYFWPDGWANRLRAIGTWLCVVGSKVCGLASPLYLGWASTSLAHSDYLATVRYSVLYCLISFAGTTLKEGQSLVYLEVAQAAFIQLSETAFGHLHSLSLDWHLRKKLGEVLRSMDRGIAACDTLMKYLFLWLIPAIVECLVVCVVFATYFKYLPLALSIFYFVFCYVFWTILLTLWRKKFRSALVKSDNEYHDIFTDSMVNFETVKYFTAEDYERKRFKDSVSRYQAGSVSVQASLSFLNVSQQVILKACLATALSLAVLGIKQRGDCCVETAGCPSVVSDCCLAVSMATCPGMQVGDFVAVLTYTLNLFAPLNFLGSVYNAVVMAIVDLTSMSELLAENPDVVDAPDAIDLPKRNAKDPDIAVEFDNVFFRYPTQPQDKGLKGLSFTMKRGTTTAIVGPTGAGKTTISRLLFRFYDVLGGAVKINGVDVRCLTQKSLRGAIGVVPQAASMFNDTIGYNLKYGKPEATQEELEQAARDAQLLGFIESLDEGWDTLVGDRGLKLSGGEKQRAAIARCLLKDPPFVLLDEATSALDTLTEKSVQEALDRLGAERTVLVIAHRLGTIRNADNIIVVKDGQAIEQGTHDELLAKKGVYAEMWNMQLHTSHSNSLVNLME